ncbi:hypothetical protein JCM1840_002149 [Sporobolomyces johnsonii]
MVHILCDSVSSSLAFGPFTRIFPNVVAVRGRTGLPSPEECTITSWSPVYYYDDLHLHTSLVFVCLPVNDSRMESMLNHLPPSLRFLLDTGDFFGSDFFMPYSLAHPNALPNLEELILPMRLQTSAGFVSLRAWAEAKGVRLTWEKDDKSWGSAHDEGFWTVVRRVDTTLEREARDASA